MNTLVVTDNFIIVNLYWIVALVVYLIVGLGLFTSNKLNNKKPALHADSEYLEALGGKDNILDKELRGSRIILKLNNYDLINREKIKELGVTGFIQSSDKLTLVIKKDAQGVYDLLFK